MIPHITHTLTSNLQQFLIMLTSLGMVAVCGLIVVALVHKSKNKVLWPVVYVFSGVNVVVWSLVLY